MGTIKINVPAVLNAGSQAKKAKKTVTTANQNIRSIKNRIDPKVINKGDLSAKFRNIDSQLKSVSQKIDRINSFADSSANKYYRTEQRVRRSVPAAAVGVRKKGFGGGSGGGRIPYTEYDGRVEARDRGELIKSLGAMCVGSSNAIADKVKSIYSVLKKDYDARGNTFKVWHYGKAILGEGKAITKIAGGIAACFAGGIPIGVVMLISGTNDFVNNTADMRLLSEGLYEEVGVNWLKDLLIENGESIGKDFLGNAQVGALIGKLVYTGVDLVTFLDGLDKMISAFGKANTVLTGKPKLSPIWGEATYSDVLDNKISFSMDPEFFIRKLMKIDPSSDGNILYECCRRIYKTFRSAYKLGKLAIDN